MKKGLKLLLDTSKITDIAGEGKKLEVSHNYSLIAAMSMVNDAKMQNAKIYDIVGLAETDSEPHMFEFMDKEKKEVYGKTIRELVISRLEQMPDNHRLHIGNKGKFNREQLIQEVKNETEIGNKIIAMELHYLKSLKHDCRVD